MARARTLRHGFFTNDDLAELAPMVRLLFAGLWTIADREGRLLDRPKKIRAEILPYDDLDVSVALDQLAASGFLVRYEVDGVRAIAITHWRKHQRPHPREEQSQIPAPSVPDTVRITEKPDLGAAEHNLGAAEPTLPRARSVPSLPSIPSGSSGAEGPSTTQARASPTAAAARNTIVFKPDDQTRIDAVGVVLAPAGLDGDPRFWRKVIDTYGEVDLEAEALKMADWQHQHRKRNCSQRFVLNWLERIKKTDAPASNGAQPHNSERFSAFRKFA